METLDTKLGSMAGHLTVESRQIRSEHRIPEHHLDWCLIFILVLPWFALAARSNWLFGSVEGGYIDPWIYLGYFLDLSSHLQAFVAYNGSRLPWILPGYAAYKLFPPLVAAYVLHIAFYYAAAFSLYLILKGTFSQGTALLSVVLMGFYGYFLEAMGWDYVDGAGITYFLIATLALTCAARSRHDWLWLTVAGASCGAMIFSHLFLVVFTPSVLLYYVLVNREHRRHSLLASGLFLALGFLALTALLGAVSYELNGSFLFFLSSLRYAPQLARLSNPFWRVPFHVWASQATWMILPTVVFLVSLAYLFLFFARRSKSDRRTRFQALFQAYFLLCGFTMLAFHVAGQPGLQIFYYASFLIPTMFLALGAQLASVAEQFGIWHWALLAAVFVAFFVLMQLLPANGQFGKWLIAHRLLLPFVLALAGSTLLFLRRADGALFGLLLICLALGFVNFTRGTSRVMDSIVQRDAFRAVVRSVRAIQSLDPGARALFWYQVDEPMGRMYRAVSSTYLWGHRLINERFPSLESGADSFHIPEPGGRIIILSNQSDAFQKADRALSLIGLASQLAAERRIQEGSIAWKMTLVEVKNWPVIENIQLGATGWPESVQIRWVSQERQMLSLSGREVHELFRSNINTTAEWQINRYGRSGGLEIQSECLAVGDSCGRYSSGHERDHLVSPFHEAPSKGVVFFSLWVKTLQAGELPTVFVQDENYSTLAVGQELLRRPDGWVMLGGTVSESPRLQKVRLAVVQKPNTASLMEKALLLDVPAKLPTVSAVAR